MGKLPPRIKVFRTHLGFHDWVVATSSQAAALEAWDVSRNLFATGEAEVTDDPKAIAAALENIGKAVRLPAAGVKAAPRAKNASSKSKSKKK